MDYTLFAIDTSGYFGKKIAGQLNKPLAGLKERNFEDGEFKIRSLENVRNRHCFVIESLFSEPGASVNDKLVKLLYLIGSLKDAAASKVTAIVPYTAFARKDRKTKHRDPLSLKYLAKMFEAVGTDHYVTMDVHNIQAYQNAFGILTDHLKAENLFIDHFLEIAGRDDVAVMSPDVGGVKRAESLRTTLRNRLNRDIPLVFMEKKRSGGEVSGEVVVGDVEGKQVIVYDDMISSGTTLVKAGKAIKERGAGKVIAAVTHGVFSGGANEKLDTDALDQILVTNTVKPVKLDRSLLEKKITILDAAPVFAEAIRHIIDGTALEEMWEGE